MVYVMQPQIQTSDISLDFVAQAGLLVLSNLFPVGTTFKLQLKIFFLVMILF